MSRLARLFGSFGEPNEGLSGSRSSHLMFVGLSCRLLVSASSPAIRSGQSLLCCAQVCAGRRGRRLRWRYRGHESVRRPWGCGLFPCLRSRHAPYAWLRRATRVRSSRLRSLGCRPLRRTRRVARAWLRICSGQCPVRP